MLNLNSLLIFSSDPENLVKFYSEVLQKEPDWKGEVGEFKGFKVGDGFLTIGPHDKVLGKNPNPERMMFNLETEDVAGEFARIKEITGAQVITEPYHPEEASDTWITTIADPDNNYFQLVSPMNF